MENLTKTGLCWGIIYGILISLLTAFFGSALPIQSITSGFLCTIYLTFMLSKADQSSKFPYWKKDENNK